MSTTTPPATSATADIETAIVKTWLDRCKMQGYSPKQQKDRQADFFAGAMAARHAGGDAGWCPADWYISILRGDLIK